MEPYVSADAWERFLLSGLLFEERLIFPDNFAYYSQHLAAHLGASRAGNSLFEVGLARGIVQAHFRTEDRTFRSSLAELQRTRALGRLPEQPELLAARMDAAIGRQSEQCPGPIKSRIAPRMFR